MSKILELISVQETAVTKRLLHLEQGVAELKMESNGRRGDASQHYLGFMEVKLVLHTTHLQLIPLSVHACSIFLPLKLVVSLHGCLADVTMDYVSQQDELKILR